MESGTGTDFFNKGSPFGHNRSVWSPTDHSHCLGLHRSILESQAASEGAVFKACELDHGHRVPNATLKLETGLKTQGVAKCRGCLQLFGYLLSSLEQ